MEKMINKRTYNHSVAFWDPRTPTTSVDEEGDRFRYFSFSSSFDFRLDGSDGAETCHVGTSGVRGADLRALDVPTKHVGGGSG
ncbi:hypothetical protein F383_11761 [Gossypium arboreum]|uniref:Uncharacterized protein n=1 Tax=Gossypium arboreum TaxID=29729 RepID=A0A0B0PP64_GOSAR|nr:hypothetical protein F383_32383 [Gossypium arboreum]KHG28238.1 hypothetical protein F383_11761 [Gossypium arboreum]